MDEISFGVVVNGSLYTRDHFDRMKHNEQVDLLVGWFKTHFVSINFDDRLIFEERQYSGVDPYLELSSEFENYVQPDVIDDAVSSLTPEGDSIWIPEFDDSVYWADDIDNEPDAFDMFKDSIQRIYEMKPKAHLLGGQEFQQHFFQILYANIFTSFEAYMVRAFINKLFESNETLHMYLENQKEFKFENPRLIDLLKGHDHLEQFMENRRKDIKVELAKASWHDLKKVPERFNCLGIDLKLSSSGLYPIIQKRNDIVHRNGRTIHDEPVVINDDELNKAIEITCSIAHAIRAHELGFEDLNKTGGF